MSSNRPGSAGYSAITVPDTPPPGFAMLMLAPANPRPSASGKGPNAPIGSFWYRLGSLPGEPSPQLEWFVRAQHLSPDHAFRVELTVDKRGSYAVGSARTDRLGVLTVHGTLGRFADQRCVGQPDLPVPIAGHHVVAVSVKADGSRNEGGSADELMDPDRSLPCGGNSDGDFTYWLVGRDVIHLDGQPTGTGQ